MWQEIENSLAIFSHEFQMEKKNSERIHEDIDKKNASLANIFMLSVDPLTTGSK